MTKYFYERTQEDKTFLMSFVPFYVSSVLDIQRKSFTAFVTDFFNYDISIKLIINNILLLPTLNKNVCFVLDR